MIVDIARPKLKWSSETEAIKQNLNAVLGMFLSVVLGFVFVVLAVVLVNNLMRTLAILIVFIILGAAAVGSTYALGKYANCKYSRIEA